MAADIIIRKQRLRIKIADEQLAHRVRKLINDQLQYDLIPVYESIFSSISKDLYIGKIKLDLGKFSIQELPALLPVKLKEELIKFIKEENIRYNFSGDTNADETILNVTGPAKQTDDRTALLYFLEKGVFPWWYTNTGKKPVAITEAMSVAETEALVINIVSLLKSVSVGKRKTILTRFIQNINEAVYVKLEDVFVSLQSDAGIKRNIILLSGSDTIRSLTNFFQLSSAKYHGLLIKYVFDHFIADKEIGLKEFILLLKKESNTESGAGISGNQSQAGSGSEKQFAIQISQLPSEIRTELKNIIAVSENKNKKNDEPLKTDGTGKNTYKENSGKKKEVSELFAEDEGVYIENAGIIILHPFLTPLFKELNLLDEQDVFLPGECGQRATIILNYLCTGKETYDEHLLAFNKIVCGLKPEDNLPAGLLLTDTERSECDSLLETVVQYWEALKGAGKEAIQETFFARKGKLSFNNNNYLLQVERMATDILIDRLPWGMGIVRLPWLDHLIYVEW
jgi:hypothetical protein